MQHIKRCILCFVAAVSGILMLLPGGVAAFVIKTGDSVVVPKGQTINETLVAVGQTVVVEGEVKGDVICAGQNIDISGTVEGDVICAGQNITLASRVGGSVRGAGQTIKMNGRVGRNVTVAGQTLNASSTVAGEMLFAGQQAIINGRIEKNVAGAADSIDIGGMIGGNADFRNKNLAFRDNGQIAGALTYTSENQIAEDANRRVLGSVKRIVPASDKPVADLKFEKIPAQRIADKIFDLLANLAVAAVLVFFFKKFTSKIAGILLEKPVRCLGWGFLFLAGVPAMALVLAITIIGIPVSILGMLVLLAALWLARVFAALAIGKKIAQDYWKNYQNSPMAQAVIGVAVLWVLFAIPVVGTMLMMVAAVWGLGSWRYVFSKGKPVSAGPIIQTHE